MRTLLSGVFLIFLSFSASCQSPYTYYGSKKLPLGFAPGKLVMTVKKGIEKNIIQTQLGLDSLNSIIGDSLLIGYSPKIRDEQYLDSIRKKITPGQDIETVAPILTNEHGTEIGTLTNRIIVKLGDQTSFGNFEELVRVAGAESFEQCRYDDKVYFVQFPGMISTLKAANELFETKKFKYSEPDFLLFGKHASSSNDLTGSKSSSLFNDGLYSQQWGFHNTGQNGGIPDADADVPEAWALTTGNSDIRIAIMDDGIQLNHPDLSPNILDTNGGGKLGGDFTTGDPNCQNYTLNNTTWGNAPLCDRLPLAEEIKGDFHGTQVAGVAAAAGFNGIGIRGVAYTSKIVSVRVTKDHPNLDGSYILVEPGWVANGIDWARGTAGVHIINFAFNMPLPSSLIDEQIVKAVGVQGRSGKGCIITAAAGNGPGEVFYPATIPSVIAVGGTKNNDQRYETSNSGVNLDVSAPASAIVTTDLTGIYGTVKDNDYATCNGTSLAAPMVAGVAALVLSVNPNITMLQARLLIEATTDKVGGYSYTNGVAGQPNGSWTSNLGHGRVNAYRAVRAATDANLLGPNLICSTGNFTLEIQPAVTRTWSTSNPAVLSINSSTGVATRVGSGSGLVTVTMTYSNGVTSYAIAKSVYVGNPAAPTSAISMMGPGSNQLCRNTSSTIAIGNTNHVAHSVTKYNWNFGAWAPYFVEYSAGGFVSTQRATFNLNNGSPSPQNIVVTAQNSCGVGPGLTTTFNAVSCGSFAMIQPNPAKDFVTLQFNESNSKLPDYIQLYEEKSQKEVYSIAYEELTRIIDIERKFSIDVKRLPRGVYFLHVKTGDSTDNEVVRVLLE